MLCIGGYINDMGGWLYVCSGECVLLWCGTAGALTWPAARAQTTAVYFLSQSRQRGKHTFFMRDGGEREEEGEGEGQRAGCRTQELYGTV
jgi:hypothetical protein